MIYTPKTRPIFGTDLTKPLPDLIEEVRDQLAHARGQLHDITSEHGWDSWTKDVTGLLTCGLVCLHNIREKMIECENQRAPTTPPMEAENG